MGVHYTVGVGTLHCITGMMDRKMYQKILSEFLLGTLRDYGTNPGSIIFQQDNDLKHTAKSTREWFDEHGFILLPWPAQSPDINPIENVWDHLAHRLAKQSVQPKTEDELWEALQEEWYKIDVGYIQKLYASMPRRVEEIIRRKGWNIPY